MGEVVSALNTDAGATYAAAQSAYADLCGHRDSHAYRAVLDWIEALGVQQQALMATCPRDKLADVQTRLRQLVALRDALAAPGDGGTGHVFD